MFPLLMMLFFFLFHRVTSLGLKLVRVTPDRSSLLIKSRPPRLVCSECEDFDERPAVAIDLLDEVPVPSDQRCGTVNIF
jgi:hypothetical protein